METEGDRAGSAPRALRQPSRPGPESPAHGQPLVRPRARRHVWGPHLPLPQRRPEDLLQRRGPGPRAGRWRPGPAPPARPPAPAPGPAAPAAAAAAPRPREPRGRRRAAPPAQLGEVIRRLRRPAAGHVVVEPPRLDAPGAPPAAPALRPVAELLLLRQPRLPRVRSVRRHGEVVGAGAARGRRGGEPEVVVLAQERVARVREPVVGDEPEAAGPGARGRVAPIEPGEGEVLECEGSPVASRAGARAGGVPPVRRLRRRLPT